MADAIVASKSLASRRFRLIQAKNRSTTHRRGSTWKADLISQLAHNLNDDGCRVRDLLAGVNAIGEDLLDEREASRDALQNGGAPSRS